MGREYSSGDRDVSFTLDGVTFTPADMSLLDFAALAKYADVEVNSPEGLEKINGFFVEIFGDDYQRFREHCGKRHTSPKVLMQIIEDVLKDLLGEDFPTQQPSNSTDGLPSTVRTLKVISSDGRFREEPLTPEREAELRAAVERAQATG